MRREQHSVEYEDRVQRALYSVRYSKNKDLKDVRYRGDLTLFSDAVPQLKALDEHNRSRNA